MGIQMKQIFEPKPLPVQKHKFCTNDSGFVIFVNIYQFKGVC